MIMRVRVQSVELMLLSGATNNDSLLPPFQHFESVLVSHSVLFDLTTLPLLFLTFNHWLASTNNLDYLLHTFIIESQRRYQNNLHRALVSPIIMHNTPFIRARTFKSVLHIKRKHTQLYSTKTGTNNATLLTRKEKVEIIVTPSAIQVYCFIN